MTRQIEALRRRATPEDAKLLDELAAERSNLSRLTLAGPGEDGVDAHGARVAELERRVDELQTQVGRRSAQFAAETAPVTLDAVQAAVPDGARLVEFAAYRPYDAGATTYGAARYVAYVLGRDGAPAWADLGEAATVDAAVSELRKALRDRTRADVTALARRVDELVMRPIRERLGDTQKLLISPDGALNLVPFAALVDEQNRYLVERYEITYLTSGRDLLRLQPRPPSPMLALVVADPLFGRKGAAGAESRLLVQEADGPDLSKANFTPLPGTAGEAAALSRLMKRQATVLTRDAATEAAMKRAGAPGIVHVATHGYFLDAGAGAADPLLRSGLALAGVNARQSGEGEDGFLTALEVTGMNLWGTRLVVLSACDTGVGEVAAGQGVYGLRRALVLAGAETSMVSLWPVSDKGTRDLMTDFYGRLLGGSSRAGALRNVQLAMLKSPARRHPYYWASFIQSGAWGPLDLGR
jgi:CHAT domain-containing protein